jgi:hypothetical protein
MFYPVVNKETKVTIIAKVPNQVYINIWSCIVTDDFTSLKICDFLFIWTNSISVSASPCSDFASHSLTPIAARSGPTLGASGLTLGASPCELWLPSCICCRRRLYSEALTKRKSKLNTIQTEINPLQPSAHYMYHRYITFNNSTFCPHRVFMCFVWIWEQTVIIFLYNIKWLVFITEI